MEPNAFGLIGKTALEARERLDKLALAPGPHERKMAEVGATALFEEALLAALHAHLNELRTVTR